ncbi:MAG TPA: hypothetical protein DHW39_04115 [Erysipelotrichaceae bacterium]|nr:hypothetical protein [Erysipelotrichaceae bacterium]
MLMKIAIAAVIFEIIGLILGRSKGTSGIGNTLAFIGSSACFIILALNVLMVLYDAFMIFVTTGHSWSELTKYLPASVISVLGIVLLLISGRLQESQDRKKLAAQREKKQTAEQKRQREEKENRIKTFASEQTAENEEERFLRKLEEEQRLAAEAMDAGNYPEAVKHYTVLADAGNTKALEQLAGLYALDQYSMTDYPKAAEYALKAGTKKTQGWLAYAYTGIEGIPADTGKVLDCLDQGSTEWLSQTMQDRILSFLYEAAEQNTDDPEEVFAILRARKEFEKKTGRSAGTEDLISEWSLAYPDHAYQKEIDKALDYAEDLKQKGNSFGTVLLVLYYIASGAEEKLKDEYRNYKNEKNELAYGQLVSQPAVESLMTAYESRKMEDLGLSSVSLPWWISKTDLIYGTADDNTIMAAANALYKAHQYGKAEYWAVQAAEMGDIKAEEMILAMIDKGVATEKTRRNTEYWSKKHLEDTAAKEKARIQVSDDYKTAEQLYKNGDYNRAFSIFEQLSKGEPLNESTIKATEMLAEMYRSGTAPGGVSIKDAQLYEMQARGARSSRNKVIERRKQNAG